MGCSISVAGIIYDLFILKKEHHRPYIKIKIKTMFISVKIIWKIIFFLRK